MSGSSRPSVAANLAEQLRCAPAAPPPIIIQVAAGAVLNLVLSPGCPATIENLQSQSKSPVGDA